MAEIDRTRRRRRSRRRGGTEERLGRWRARVHFAQQLREKWERKYRVKDLELTYLGQQSENETIEDDEVWLNHFFATVQTQIPALLPRQMAFRVEPKAGKEPFGRLEAKIQANLLRSIAEGNDNHLDFEARLALAQSFFRVGVLKVSYDPRFENNPRSGEPLIEDIEGVGNIPLEPDEVLTDEVYTWDWVNAKHMLLPDAGPSPRKWPWIGEEVELTLDDARKDTRFPRNLRNQFVANASADTGQIMSTGNIRSDAPGERESARFRYFECWDINEKRLVAWADGQTFDTFIIDEPYPDGIDDSPYSILSFVPILGPNTSPWPMPLVFNWLPLQQQYNILREQQLNAGKRTARKYFYESSTFTDGEEQDKMNSSVDNQGVMIADVTRPPIPYTDPPLGIDVARNIPILRADWQIITGATGARLSDSEADTATEAVLIEQSASLRDSSMRAIVEKWLGKSGSRMLQLVKQTLELDIWVQIRGFGGKDFQEFLQTPGLQSMLALQFGQENVQGFMAALQLSPRLQESFKERFGNLKPIQVTRSELQFESDVRIIPNSSRPVQQAQMVRMTQGLPMIIATGSPALIEEYISSFDLASGELITEEIMLTVRQAQQAQAAQQGQVPGRGGAGGASVPGQTGTSPLAQAGGLGRLGL